MHENDEETDDRVTVEYALRSPADLTFRAVPRRAAPHTPRQLPHKFR